jgi:integrase
MPKRNLPAEIAAANAELKLYGARLVIEKRATSPSLYLRGTMPVKGNESAKARQRLLLDARATSEGIRYAKKEALRLSVLLDQGKPFWAAVERASEGDTCAQAIAKFKKDWAKSQKGTREYLDRKFHNYFWLKGFSKLPSDMLLTPTVLEATLYAGWEADTSGRKIAAQNFARLAKFMGISADLKGGKYSSRSVSRNIPGKEVVEQAIDAMMTGPFRNEEYRLSRWGWQWIAGMMACYGLRDHEAFSCSVRWEDVEGVRWLACDVSHVTPMGTPTKTGGRTVYPISMDWVERWELGLVRRPAINPKISQDYGGRTCKAFKRCGMPFKPYDLRHFYAIEMALSDVKDVVRSAMMGHSITMNNEIYQAHIRPDQVKRSFVKSLGKAKPPQI